MFALFRRNRGGSDPRERRPSARTPRRLTLESLEGRALLSTVGLTTAQVGQQAAPASTVTVSQSFPISISVFVPCANGGAGEYVDLSGDLHDLYHLTFDGQGGVHVKFQDNPQGISGVGLTTGDKYQGTGVTETEFNVKVGEEYTYVNNFRIIGQGPGNNYLVHDNFHFTINANGTVTAYHDNFSVECK